MSRSEELERVERLVQAAAESCGVEVVEISYRGQGSRPVLRIDIDREGPQGVGLADCERVSRVVGASLEREGILGTVEYQLQVSSPGLDRPIRSTDDARRNRGRPVILTARTSEGSVEEIRGVLVGIDEGRFMIATGGSATTGVPVERVLSALPDPGRPTAQPDRARRVKARRARDIV